MVLSISRVEPTYAATAKSVPGAATSTGKSVDQSTRAMKSIWTSGAKAKTVVCGRDEHVGAALAVGYERLDVADGAAEREGLRALGRAEVDVARANGEAVGIADDGAYDDFDCEAQIGDHAAEDGDLGRVFLAEEGEVGLGGDDKLGDDCGDAAKVAGARSAVEAVAEAGDFDKCGIGAVGVELFDRRSEEDIGSLGFGEGAVGRERAGIASVVLIGAELRGVDKEADGDVGAGRAGGAQERSVACVERAHRGHEADGVALRATKRAGPVAEFDDSSEDLHQRRFDFCFNTSRAARFTTASAPSRLIWTILRADILRSDSDR